MGVGLERFDIGVERLEEGEDMGTGVVLEGLVLSLGLEVEVGVEVGFRGDLAFDVELVGVRDPTALVDTDDGAPIGLLFN